MQVYLDPTARAKYDDRLGSWTFAATASVPTPSTLPTPVTPTASLLSSSGSISEPTVLKSSSPMMPSRVPCDDVSCLIVFRSPSVEGKKVFLKGLFCIEEKISPMSASPPSASFTPPSNIPSATRLAVTLREAAEGMRHATDKGIGVDCEDVSSIDVDNIAFLERNFTSEEILYCKRAKSPSEVRPLV